ncbi:2-oxo-4-hydroxy-4-carboxy-5-ureidoimidazoline decarboxylase [Cryobacterium psychrotolerans]|uniref:2-oxo-4-hydroxy-4-carboxy-5-ureidoimidazoline decarboxylase n=1 Tax=Cryobacterium psychrotolerans TaxID=386301 RepID=A0A1G9ERA2_9MICO|nr:MULTISPECIES: 2-oxo-4-hydroxy-4-carboxy-5-ureidoimidazoline decarboxylase [Cryobacterium]TFD41988.1 2-oxo-4-hydroxy-4-carboxy-5-ureidoimidazoline decarboxylase [Cryobacterium sp. TMT1-2-1]TFD83646.1 2-oxo-4-hydroxy-4-carboxy-5-ureidoimidazoline decarboxylase [Cryobacterium psychrotolerans]SDK78722.1 2-oxo-4-hydroxy-4-carboxy-5-ureidoimidazoline decarboxylase [Cryobacterium psychrotolerans]
MTLEQFNLLDREQARDAVRPCVQIARWVDGVVDARPYSDVEELLTVARHIAAPWTIAEIDGALARHARIGERARGAHAEASLSRSEQAGIDPGDTAVAEALAAGNRAYEERFGRVFLIRAARRTPEEILAALRSRLTHSPEEEIPVVADQLREIAVLRLEGILTS